jgi:predicted alpha/beta hydrolase
VSALKQRASSQGALHTDGMDDSLTTADGLALQLREWPCERPHGSVLIVHGLGEHIGRYLHVAQHLNDWGWNVIGYDQRGHGASEGPRGRLAAADDLLLDLSRVIDAVRAAHDGPLVLLGHSLGGLVAARFVAEGRTARRGRSRAARVAARWRRRPWSRRSGTARSMRWCCRRRRSTPACSAAQKVLLAVLGPLTPNSRSATV